MNTEKIALDEMESSLSSAAVAAERLIAALRTLDQVIDLAQTGAAKAAR